MQLNIPVTPEEMRVLLRAIATAANAGMLPDEIDKAQALVNRCDLGAAGHIGQRFAIAADALRCAREALARQRVLW